MQRNRVLVVEDDDDIRRALVLALRGEGYDVTALADARDGAAVAASAPDLALLDVGLPGPDGFEVARALRRQRDVPVVFLTARDAVADRLTGFGLGADDYVVKPFSLPELLARVAVVLRRTGKGGSARVVVGDLVVDTDARQATRAGTVLDLTATEWRLLEHLALHRGKVLSKTQLLTGVWGYDAYDPNLVEVHVSALRRKTDALGPRLVQTVRGLGYVLREP